MEYFGNKGMVVSSIRSNVSTTKHNQPARLRSLIMLLCDRVEILEEMADDLKCKRTCLPEVGVKTKVNP